MRKAKIKAEQKGQGTVAVQQTPGLHSVARQCPTGKEFAQSRDKQEGDAAEVVAAAEA
jgi:hypothetical protein